MQIGNSLFYAMIIIIVVVVVIITNQCAVLLSIIWLVTL